MTLLTVDREAAQGSTRSQAYRGRKYPMLAGTQQKAGIQ